MDLHRKYGYYNIVVLLRSSLISLTRSKTRFISVDYSHWVVLVGRMMKETLIIPPFRLVCHGRRRTHLTPTTISIKTFLEGQCFLFFGTDHRISLPSINLLDCLQSSFSVRFSYMKKKEYQTTALLYFTLIDPGPGLGGV